MRKLACLYVPLKEFEHLKLLELFKDKQWARSELFALNDRSGTVLFNPEERRQWANSPSDERSVDQTIFELSDERIIVQLIEGIRYNDTSDSHWKYWGVTVFPRPGMVNCEDVSNRLTIVLSGVGVGEDRMQKAYFEEGAKVAFTQLEHANNL